MSDLVKAAAAFIETYKKGPILKEVEEKLGRPLADYEAVYFIDGQIQVGFKPGVPYEYLQCKVCGNRVTGLSKPDTPD